MSMTMNPATISAGNVTPSARPFCATIAAEATLSSTMVNIIEKKDIDTDALSVAFQGHSNDNASSLAPFKIADGANAALYMNIACAITADDSVSVTGTVDLYYIDVGKED